MKKFAGLIFAAAIALSVAMPIKAEAKRWMHPGVSGRGVAVSGDTEIQVKSERVTLKTTDVPLRITAEYELYNPAATPQDITLIYPLDDENYMDNYGYSVTADGEKVDGKIRHAAYFKEFDYENGLKLSDEKIKDEFFAEDLPVTVYTYFAERESEGEITFSFVPEETRVFAEWGSYEKKKDGSDTVGIILGAENTFELYVMGKEIPAPEFECKCRGNIRLSGSRKTVLGALIAKPPEAVSETDWFNAVIACLNHESEGGAVGDAYIFFPQNWLYRWYVYTITVPAGGTVINAVSGEVYPSINEAYEPYLETYCYAVSPLAAEEFSFTAVTDYFMYSAGGFEKTETGYVYSGEKPQEYVSITLCSAENPKKVVTAWEIFLYVLAALIIIIIAAPIIALVAILIVRAARKGKNENLR